ncbi:MAG: ATP-binding protein [Bacteroidetes bacterium]|nr:ATP-binding protein [Bacteroidota bacterium]
MDKLSPRALNILIAMLLSTIVSIASLYFYASLTSFATIWLVTFFSASLLVYYAVDIYLRNRIHLVYKVIHQFKLNRSQKDSLGSMQADDPLKEMEIEVADWAKNKSLEIEDLKKLEQFRKEFLGNLSHELKTPLFNIQGYVHTLLEGAMDDPKVSKTFLERAATSVERLSSLVDDLDEISKLERGEIFIEKENFDIVHLVREVFESLELKAKLKNMLLDLKDGSEKPHFIHADKDKIRQVITNLADNSIKYGNQGGNTLANFYEMGENILVEITDNGIGISEEHLTRLFERFYRVDKHRSREQGGTGLGLAIVKHILEAHHQTIHVRSTVGVGTTFAFTLQKVK